MKLILALFLIFSLSFQIKAQEGSVDLNQLVTELQKSSNHPDKMNLVWWIPNEFWIVSMQQDDVSQAEVDEIIETLGKYSIFAVVEGTMSSFGAVTYYSEEDIRESIFLTGPDNDKYVPIKNSSVDPNTKMILDVMKPMFKNLLGPMGENIHFYLFEGTNKNGDILLDPMSPGNFSINVIDESYGYRLPLGSLMAPKKCPFDDEVLNGAWKFCPWHGKELVEN